jgi:hypothetical protein
MKDTTKPITILSEFVKITKLEYMLLHVCLSECNNSEQTRRNVIKFDIGILFCVVNYLKGTARGRQATDGNIIRRMRFVCSITKSTNTQSEY